MQGITSTFRRMFRRHRCRRYPVQHVRLNETSMLTALLLLLLSASAISATQDSSKFLPKASNNKMVVIEAENYYATRTATSGEAWQTIRDTTFLTSDINSVVSAEKAMQILPDSGRSYSSSITSRAARLDYPVAFASAGDYYVWVRGKSPSSGSNSLHVGINNTLASSGTGINSSAASTVYAWFNRTSGGTVARITVPSAGLHTVNVWMSEDGLLFDKLLLTRESGFLPTQLGPSQSDQGQYTSYPVDSAPTLLNWSFDEDPSYGKATDAIKKATMTCSACPVAATGRIGGAFRFNGVASMTLRNSLTDFTTSQGFAIETFVRMDTRCTSTQGILGAKSSSSAYGWSLQCSNSKVVANLTDSSGAGSTTNLVSSASIDDGKWHHVVLVRDGFYKENRLYVDGVLQTARTVNYTGTFTSGAPLTVGKATVGSAAKGFYGYIDGLSVNGRALRTDEVKQAFKGKTSGLYRSMWGCEAPVAIMPLGDSITAGTNGSATKLFGTYRTRLYDLLAESGYNTDFVGSAWSRHTNDKDRNHEGWPGYSSYHIRNQVIGFLNMNRPDIVLLHIGTNDLSTALSGTTDLLKKVDQFSTSLPVIVARIINQQTYNPAVKTYNQQLASMVASRIASGDRLYLVDQEPVLDYARDMFDNLHPSIDGASKMSTPWFNELITMLPRCRPAVPVIVSAPAWQGKKGVALSFTPEVLGHPLGTFSLTSNPSGMQINPTTGEIRWTSPTAGTHLVRVKVSNNKGSDTRDFSLKIQ